MLLIPHEHQQPSFLFTLVLAFTFFIVSKIVLKILLLSLKTSPYKAEMTTITTIAIRIYHHVTFVKLAMVARIYTSPHETINLAILNLTGYTLLASIVLKMKNTIYAKPVEIAAPFAPNALIKK